MVRLLIKLGLFFVTGLMLAAPAHATFPGANGKIVFSRFTGDRFDLYTINPDGSGERLLVTGGSHPSWSPDGQKVAFTRQAVFGASPVSLAVIDADGSHLRDLSDNVLRFARPVWSPDGSRIAFARDDNGSWSLDVVKVDGSQLSKVANAPLLSSRTDHPIDWSPDGARLVFSANEDIETVRLDGSDLRNLTNSVDEESDPAWSPAGDKIAFSLVPLAEGSPRPDIYVINPDGTGFSKVSADAHDVDPAWSPDGTRLTFTHEFQDPPSFVGVVDFNGNPEPRFIENAERALWSPDGTKLLFLAFDSTTNAFFPATSNPDGTARTALAGGWVVVGLDWQPLPSKNRAKKCKASGKEGRGFGHCVAGSR